MCVVVASLLCAIAVSGVRVFFVCCGAFVRVTLHVLTVCCLSSGSCIPLLLLHRSCVPISACSYPLALSPPSTPHQISFRHIACRVQCTPILDQTHLFSSHFFPVSFLPCVAYPAHASHHTFFVQFPLPSRFRSESLSHSIP